MKFACHVEEIDISGIRKSFEGAGPGAINLGLLGQPDFDTPDHISGRRSRRSRRGSRDTP